jgi:hypothetical protein
VEQAKAQIAIVPASPGMSARRGGPKGSAAANLIRVALLSFKTAALSRA